MRNFFARLFAALSHALGRLRSGAAGAFQFAHDAVEEAVEPVTARLPWLRDRAADAGHAGASLAAGLLSLPGAVLGSILPRPAPGPQAVADDAVAYDDNRNGSIPPVPAKEMAALEAGAMAGQAIHAAAAALACGDDARAERHAANLPSNVRDWLVNLTPKQLARVIATDVYPLVAHVAGRSPAPGLPPVQAAPAPITDRDRMQKALAEIRRIARAERLEAVERATGGGRPAALPSLDEDDYVPEQRRSYQGPRPAFH